MHHYTRCLRKNLPLYFHLYLSRFLVDFVIFAPLERGMKTLQRSCQMFNFAINMFAHYLVTQNTAQNSRPLLQCVRLNRLFEIFA